MSEIENGAPIGLEQPLGMQIGYWDYTVNPAVFRVVSTNNALPSTGSGGGGGGSNASVGATGTTPPTSATESGFINGAGNLVAVSPTSPLPVYNTITNTPYSRDTAFGTAVSHASKATAATLYSFDVSSTSAALNWIQFFNSATAPASGATPVYSFAISAGSATSPSDVLKDAQFFGTAGQAFSSGLAWGISTTQGTYTAAASGTPFGVTVHYV